MLTVRMSSLPNDIYWQERAAMRQEIYNRADNQMLQQLGEAYKDAQNQISAEMQRMIGSYARRTGMSFQEATAILREPAPQREFKRLRDLMEALEDSPAKLSIRARLNAESVRFRLTNLRALQESANITCAKLGQKELDLGTQTLRQVGKDAYMRTAFDLQKGTQVGWNASGVSERQLTQMLKDKWTGISYSDRLWNNTERLSQMVSREMASGLMGGKDHDRIIRDLMKTFDVSRYVAARLVVTETAYVANHSELKSYIDSGVEEYQFVAIFDEKTSDVCRAHSSKVYRVADAKPGMNLPPLHPWCRSTTIPVYGLDWLATVNRSVKTGDGKYILIPATWDYSQWERWQAAGCPPIAA
jgi:SPP1 gp7 family putative phage head morphogenesis protein